MPDRDPPLGLESLPETMNGKSPSDPDGGPRAVTVSVTVAPPSVGTLLVWERVEVESTGRPVTLKVSAGMVPVEPETRVNVTVNVVLVDLRTVWLLETVIPKS